ncbi:MAG: hypothetical protein QME45_01435 [Clostridiales bacterium]|nr:hypothetical protein [Clostridiales bacterium]HBM81355.1 hypothetical protein [Clostridiaceae bacterium]
MGKISEFIRNYFSGYTIFLFLISSYLLVFADTKELKTEGFKNESRFSFIAGLVYAAIAICALIAIIIMHL